MTAAAFATLWRPAVGSLTVIGAARPSPRSSTVVPAGLNSWIVARSRVGGVAVVADVPSVAARRVRAWPGSIDDLEFTDLARPVGEPRSEGRAPGSPALITRVGLATAPAAARSHASNMSTAADSSANTSGWSHSTLVTMATAVVGIEVAGVLVGLDDELRALPPPAPWPGSRR